MYVFQLVLILFFDAVYFNRFVFTLKALSDFGHLCFDNRQLDFYVTHFNILQTGGRETAP